MRRSKVTWVLKENSADADTVLFITYTLTQHIFRNMAAANESTEQQVTRYLRSGGASGDDIADFFDWCIQLCTGQQEADVEKRIRYNVYRLWARLLRKRRAPFSRRDRFVFDDRLKNYIRHLTGGEIVDQEPHAGARHVTATQFVDHVVRRLDDAF